MARPRWRSISVGVAVIATISVCGWFVVVRLNALAPLLCFAPADQAAMIGMFEGDPLYSVTPEDGRLREEKATNYECDNGHGGSPTDPKFAKVSRLYTVPAVYNVAQLHERFTQAATAADWLIYEEKVDDENPDPYVYVRYCKLFGERVVDAWIQSRRGQRGPELEVTLDARTDDSICVSLT
jgi:hypothetical protein